MYKRTVNRVETEANMGLGIDRLMNTEFIEITNIDKTPMPTWCAEITFNTSKRYGEIRDFIDNLRSEGYNMMLVDDFSGGDSILIPYL